MLHIHLYYHTDKTLKIAEHFAMNFIVIQEFKRKELVYYIFKF